jgi:hypothetical protein
MSSRVIGGFALVALAIAAACGSADSGPSSSPTPTASPVPTPTLSPLIRTPGPTGAPPETDYRLIYREYSAVEDIIWAALPTDPNQRQEIVRIPHRDGYGVKAALSPDGAIVAFLSLPDAASGPDASQAEAFLIDLESEKREAVKIAGGVDYNYTPLWSPDSRLVYMRQYAGPEFLSASVMIVRVSVAHTDDKTPTPTPTQPPGIAPAPTPEPVQLVLKDTVAHVLAFAPIGFADDKKSMFFVQEQGGTQASTLIGIYSPATTEGVDALHKLAEDAWYAAQLENQRLIDEAAANGLPPPEITVTPAPTPAPNSRFVVQISEQAAFDYSLSPDTHKVAYVNQQITDTGNIRNQTFIADLVTAEAKLLGVPGVADGEFVRPEWFPDGRLTIGFIPSSGGPGQTLLMTLDGTELHFLLQPAAGFDIPRRWSPDGTWLAVEHRTGGSPANPGDGTIDLVSLSGQRYTVPGTVNANSDTVLGWRHKDEIVLPEE